MGRAIRRIAAEFENGYDYPLDWNQLCREHGWTLSMVPLPTERERLGRALLWGARTFLEELSDAIHPDGPRW
jgi:hypothetical protein